jgi:peptidoglycan/xylan/chitin deacetylase (PgdA/CDA1 family)
MHLTAMRVFVAGALVAMTSLVTLAATQQSWRDARVLAPAPALEVAVAPADSAVAEATTPAPDSATPVPTASPTPASHILLAAGLTQSMPPMPPSRATASPTPASPAQVVPGSTPSTPTAAPAVTPAAACPGNPNALGVSRVVEIDTTGGPGFGFEHFKAYDFLKINEVVLTFDDGPWPNNTPAVLAALAAQCTKALFFPIGKHAMWHPEILKQVAEAGHTIGSHTWSHADLSKKGVVGKDEIEKGLSAVQLALGETKPAPFFRFPYLRQPPELQTYLGERNTAMFSTDMDSFDFKLRKPEQVVRSVMTKLKKHGKGIVLMHDFQKHTAEALPELLRQMQAAGYKVVQVKAKDTAKTLPQYDAMVAQEIKGGGTAGRPISNVVRTINTYGDAPPPVEAPK